MQACTISFFSSSKDVFYISNLITYREELARSLRVNEVKADQLGIVLFVGLGKWLMSPVAFGFWPVE